MQIINIVTIFLSSTALVLANVEKVIFLGPRQPVTRHNLLDIHNSGHPVLNHSRSSIRKHLIASFPSETNSWRGSESWVILDALEEGKRYEVRICWSATVSESVFFLPHQNRWSCMHVPS